MNQFPAILNDEKIGERNIEFRDALFSLNQNAITIDNYSDLTGIYLRVKDPGIRMRVLRLLYDFDFPALKQFFADAFKSHRGLDMKIYAMRGLAKFIAEADVEKLMQKFNESLIKRPKHTPYNNVEYEYLKGQNALPYLVKKYNYKCFENTLAQVNRQYDDMPDAFKGHFTINENGDHVSLTTPEEYKRIMDKFWEEDRKKYYK